MMATWGKEGRLTFESEDKAFKARIGGLFQMNFGFYSIDPYAQNLLPDSGLQQGSEFRRARLRSDGNFCTYMEWVFEMDFSRASDNRRDILTAPDPNVTFNNVFVGMHDIPLLGTLRVGHIKEELSFTVQVVVEISPLWNALVFGMLLKIPIFLAMVAPSATPIWKTMFIPGLVYFKPTHALGHLQSAIPLNLHLMSGFA